MRFPRIVGTRTGAWRIGRMNEPQQQQKTAPSDGSYTIDGIPYQVKQGDPIPEGAEFSAANEEEATKEKTGDQAGDQTAKTSAKKPGETTQASGPKETG
jgi:hypothetical protein